MAENTVSNSLPPSSAQSKVTVGGSSIASGGTAAMHHHHHHHHHHHNHHKSMDMGGSGKGGGGSKHHTNVIHRTTSESLRLGGGGAGSGSSMNNSVSGSGGGSTMGTGGGGGNGNIGSNENSVSSSSMLNSSTSANSISRKSASSSTSGGGGAGHGGAGGGIGGAAGPGGKTSSFTITSVIVGPGKHSADNGDDSADDLDESHTDDNSRITDFENETPSFSEDTFSKEDVFFTNAIGSVPVIPTSSQYGLAIVAPNDRTHGGEVLADAMHVSVTDGGINIMGHGKGEMSDGKELHHRNERFKVVKIESTEPFKRGRWVCMDYLDHTTLQQPKEISTGAEGNESSGGTNATVTTQDSGVGMNDNASFAPTDGTIASELPSMDYHPNAVSSSSVVVGSSVAASTSTTTASNVSSALHGMLNNESPGQSLNLPLAGGSTNGGGGTGTAGNTTTSHVQSNTTGQGNGTVGGGVGIPHSLPQTQLQNALAGQQPQQPNAAYSQGQQGQSQYYPHTMTNLADLNQQTVSNPQAHQHHQHGATLPSNMQIHPQPQPPQQQQQQQPQQPNTTAVSSSNILPPLVAPIPTSQEMNIIINNPTIQSSFPSPHQQFKPQQPQQTASQTNSPVVVPTSLLDNNTTVSGAPGESVPLNSATTGATILSPSGGSGNAVSAISATGGGSAHDTAGSVSIVTDSLMNSSPSATSSPVTSSAQIIPQPATFAPPPGAGASTASIGDPSSTVAQNTTTAPNSVANGSSNTAVGGSTTTNGSNCVVAAGSPSSTGAIGSASSIPVATVAGSSGTDQLSSEAKLLSAVSGVTAGTVAGDGEDPEKANAEDGER
uniref:Uncharacterized protein n=1 Tax=Anopheles culicifacies TaxID=139723 RepID=A0A182M544_9DIPT